MLPTILPSCHRHHAGGRITSYKNAPRPLWNRRCCGYQIRECSIHSGMYCLKIIHCHHVPLLFIFHHLSGSASSVSFRLALYYGNMRNQSQALRSPSSPNIRFMFCTACPAAPFTRLSMRSHHHDSPDASRIDLKIQYPHSCFPRPIWSPGTRPWIQHADKLLIRIILIVNRLDLLVRRKTSVRLFRQGGICCRQDSAVHGHQMRRKIRSATGLPAA